MAWTAELAIVAGRVDLLLEEVRGARSIAARRFALDALARGLLFSDPGSVDPETRQAALALRVDPSTVMAAEAPRQPHAVPVPLVDRGRSIAFVRQVHVAFDPVGLLADDGFLEPHTRHSIAHAILAAARRAPPPSDPALHRLVAARPTALSSVRVDGPSLGAAAYLSALSLFSGRPVHEGLVVTGAVRGDAVVGVGAMEEKVRAAHHHGAHTIVVPAADASEARRVAGELESGPRVIAVEDLEGLRRTGLAMNREPRKRPERAVEEARRLFSTGWRGYRWPRVHEALSRLSGTLPNERVDLRVDVLSRLAAAQRHLGDPVGSLAILEEADALVGSDAGRVGVPDENIAYLFQQKAMTCRQLCRFGEATRAARRGAKVAQRARLRGLHIKALGCVGLVAMSRGDVERAIAAFAESLEVTCAFEPYRTARTHAYLIEAHGAAGHYDKARQHFEAAMSELDTVEDETDRRARESWVRTSWGGALLALGRAEEALVALDVAAVRTSLEEEPLPGLLARRWLGLALIEQGSVSQGFEVLAASPLVHGRALEPHLGFLAHLNVLFEAEARCRYDAWGPDIFGRVARALEHVPRYGRVDRFLGRPLATARRALQQGGPPPARAFETLLVRCARLS